MGRLRNILLAAAIGAALTASGAAAENAPEPTAATEEAPTQPASETAAPAPATNQQPTLEQGDSLAAPTGGQKAANGGTAPGHSASKKNSEVLRKGSSRELLLSMRTDREDCPNPSKIRLHDGVVSLRSCEEKQMERTSTLRDYTKE